jgi:hypothetical protein
MRFPDQLVAATCVTLFAFIPFSRGEEIDVEFSNFSVGQTFPNSSLPRTITADGVDVELSKYNNSSGANGRIIDSSLFGMPNNAMFLAANLRAEIVLPAFSEGGFFFFRNQGRTNLLEVNGETLDFTNAALAGTAFGTVGGVEVHSSPLTGSFRSVKLDGLITTLAFIGQELTIDSVELGIGLPGDHNLDGVVDAGDYVVWRKGLGTSFTQDDYNVWRSHFGQSAGSGSALSSVESLSAAVPEPAFAPLMLILGILVTCSRRRLAVP